MGKFLKGRKNVDSRQKSRRVSFNGVLEETCNALRRSRSRMNCFWRLLQDARYKNFSTHSYREVRERERPRSSALLYNKSSALAELECTDLARLRLRSSGACICVSRCAKRLERRGMDMWTALVHDPVEHATATQFTHVNPAYAG